MRKLLILLLLILPTFLKGQANSHYLTDAQKYYSETVYIPWTQQYPGVNCVPSFLWSVTRTKIINEYGQHLYKMYFKSNSYCNGVFRGTHINGISLYVNGALMNKQSKYWVNFIDIYQPPTLTFWSEGNPVLNFYWDNVLIN